MQGPKRMLIGQMERFRNGEALTLPPPVYKQSNAKKGRIDTGTHHFRTGATPGCRDLHGPLQNAAVAAGSGWAGLSETA